MTGNEQHGHPQRPFLTAVPWTQLEMWAQSSPCKSLLFVDTCHGAGAATGRLVTRDPLSKFPRPGYGVAFLSGSHYRDKGYELDRFRQGAFTQAILDTLQATTTADKNNRVSLMELQLSVARRVPEMTSQRQIPAYSKPLEMDDFDLFVLP